MSEALDGAGGPAFKSIETNAVPAPVPASHVGDSCRRNLTSPTCIERDRTDQLGVQQGRRLTHELDLLEASLSAAERAAICCRPTRSARTSDSDDEIASRRAELNRYDLALRQRERALDEQRRLLAQAHERLVRTKESLRRAIGRFRSHVAEQAATLSERERRAEAAWAQLMEDRRAFARNQMRLKANLRLPASRSPDAADEQD